MYSAPLNTRIPSFVVSTVKYIAIGVTLCMGLHTPGHAEAVTDLTGNNHNFNANLDVSNFKLASVALNSAKSSLDFMPSGKVDTRTNRNNTPIARAERPLVSMGNAWWAQPVLSLQVLGDDAAGNLNVNPAVFLGTENTEEGVADFYELMYKTATNSASIVLGTINTSVENLRAGIILKSFPPAQDNFDYFNIGRNVASGAVYGVNDIFLSLMGLASLFLMYSHQKMILRQNNTRV